VFGDVEGTKTDMDAAWKILDTLEGPENSVNAAYYSVAADYYKVGVSVISISHMF
jgi:26S proteasome regulatory subunit N9